MKESDIQKSIVEWLRYNGIYCQRINSGKLFARYGDVTRAIKLADEGTPDIIACINGKFVGIEVKKDQYEIAKWISVSAKYEQTRKVPKTYERIKNQYEHCKQIRNRGGFYFLVCSIEQLKENIEKYLQ